MLTPINCFGPVIGFETIAVSSIASFFLEKFEGEEGKTVQIERRTRRDGTVPQPLCIHDITHSLL